MRNKMIFYGILLVLVVLFFVTAILYKVYEIEFLPAPFFGALMGVFITALVTYLLLSGQAESETKKEREIRIYQKQIRVYSEFSSKMWEMLEDDEITDGKLKELRNICFRNLVFYLNQSQINRICEQINFIEDYDTASAAAGEITHILKNSLTEDENVKSSDLKKLFNSFKLNKNQQYGEEIVLENKQTDTLETFIKPDEKDITYWHFNTWGDEQIEAFKKGNWVLNLIEYGEVWRTNSLKQVKPNDVIFLFRRGGFGYIGAFRVVINEKEKSHFKILEPGNDYTKEQIEKYDIYNSLADGATLSSNLFVEPIAFNYKGIGYVTVRRRTIERFVNDAQTINTYLERFSGKNLPDERMIDGNKINEKTDVKITQENQQFFNSLCQK